jgi:hypothetical protein
LIPTPSQRLLDIGFVLLKLISTQRGLKSVSTSVKGIGDANTVFSGSMFDEYMQKEYRKRIQRQQESWELRGKTDGIKVTNPFGDEDALARFNDLDIFTKVGHSSFSKGKRLRELLCVDSSPSATHTMGIGQARTYSGQNECCRRR